MAIPAATRYQSTSDEWRTAGWRCLKFSSESPQYYSYRYERTSPTAFVAVAEGDLDGDGVTSSFSLGGAIAGAEVIHAPSITELSPEE